MTKKKNLPVLDNRETSLHVFDNQERRIHQAEYIAGFDEAGRGPLAGPLSCAGVILPKDFDCPLINDSKKLTDKQRREAYKIIKEKALCYCVKLIPVETIDERNILEADRYGRRECLKEISKTIVPDFLITDYRNLPTEIPFLSIPKGDATSLNVAAASILAKVTRDDYRIELDKRYPLYQFKKNKGYGTKQHLKAIEDYGYIKGVHRLSFEPVKDRFLEIEQLKLF